MHSQMINERPSELQGYVSVKILELLRVVHTRALRIWIENIFSDFNFFLSKISRSDRGSNLRSFDFESFSTRLLKPLSYRANQNYSKTNRFYTKQICVGFFHFALFVISCIVKGAYWLKSPKKIFWPWNFFGGYFWATESRDTKIFEKKVLESGWAGASKKDDFWL